MAELRDRARKFFRRSSSQQAQDISIQSQRQRSPSQPEASGTSPLKRARPSWSRSASQSASTDHTASPLPKAADKSTPKSFVQDRIAPVLTVQEPSPDRGIEPATTVLIDPVPSKTHPLALPTPDSRPTSPLSQPQTQTAADTVEVATNLGEPHQEPTAKRDYFGPFLKTEKKMTRRKVWIKRAGASPTLVQITDEDLVDDVRDMVLRKYANSLGRVWDAPDVTIRIVPRERSQAERVLGPDEPICNLLDAYFPGGQNLEEALLIDVPRKRTPLPSPRVPHPHMSYEDSRPLENGNDYFPPMPAGSPHPSQSATSHESRPSIHLPPQPHSIGVLETGQLPVLPSPRESRKGHHRPKAHRQHTSSPTILTASGLAAHPTQYRDTRDPRQQWGRMNSDSKYPGHRTSVPAPPPLPSPQIQEVSKVVSSEGASPPLESITSPRPPKSKKIRNKASVSEARRPEAEELRPSHPPAKIFSVIEATVPPINVLIVEDNPINLRLLEMFTKRLKVRWSSVMNGRDAVTKWRSGGFHLVLMDIQLPIMSGLEATKEIRRLERVNGIGVFAKGEAEDAVHAIKRSGSISEPPEDVQVDGDDKLSVEGQFKSPVIIVALTASSLQSDRHEALAAGCNDFLTKVSRKTRAGAQAFQTWLTFPLSRCISRGWSVR